MNTNVNTSNSLICYDILELGKQLQPIGMLVVLDSILNRITANRTKGKILIFSLMKYTYYSNMNILQISYLHFGKELENMELLYRDNSKCRRLITKSYSKNYAC